MATNVFMNGIFFNSKQNQPDISLTCYVKEPKTNPIETLVMTIQWLSVVLLSTEYAIQTSKLCCMRQAG